MIDFAPGDVVAFDCETELIAPGMLAPRLICASVAYAGGAALLSPDEARAVFRDILRSQAILAGANLPFDIAVMLADAERRDKDSGAWGSGAGEYDDLVDLVFAKYEQGEVHDVLIAQALDAVAGGHLFKLPNGMDLRSPSTGEVKKRYSLEIVHHILTGERDAKADDFWRVRYGILQHVPMDEWPEDARRYPVADARNTRTDALIQRGGPRTVREHGWLPLSGAAHQMCEHCHATDEGFGTIPPCVPREVPGRPHRNIEGVPRECRADLALHLGAVWGLRTDGPWVEALAAKVERQHAEHQAEFADWMKWAHLPSCLKRGAGALPRGDRSLCSKTCDHGKEDGPRVTREVALAYGASGTCPRCGGTGRAVGSKGNEVGCTPRNFPGEVTCDATGLDLSTARGMRLTDSGAVCCDRDALQDSGDDRLTLYGDDEFEKTRQTYIPYVRRGVDHAMTLSPNPILETLRVSYHGPQQQFSREGEIRPSFRARRGWVYCSADFSGVELCSLAQCCLWYVGFSRMAQIIVETGDPGGLHTAFGAELVGEDPVTFKAKVKAGDKAAKLARQSAKFFDFGLPGGMGAAKLVVTARKKNSGRTYSPAGPRVDEKGRRYYDGMRFCILLGGREKCGERRVSEWKGRACPPVCLACVEQAEQKRRMWLDFFPEVPKYFDYVTKRTDASGTIELPLPGTLRGGVGFSDGANGHFQTLAAILAKTALWNATRECYADRTSVLYGNARIPFFQHDELFCELREESAHLTAPRVGLIMENARDGILPDVPVKVEPALSRAWLKAMEAYYDEQGRLAPWEEGPAGKQWLEEKGWVL